MTTIIKLEINGRVQGVGFRRSVETFVAKNTPNVVGFVKNLTNGNVEVVASGSDEELSQLIKFCHKGPLLSSVKAVREERPYVCEENFDRFEIRY